MDLFLIKECFSGDEKKLLITQKQIAEHKKFDVFIKIWLKLTQSGIDKYELEKIKEDDPEIGNLVNLAIESCGRSRK